MAPCSGLSTRASSESLSPSARVVWLCSSMSTALRVSSFINRVMILCNTAYAPELNHQEHVWDELREKEFPNLVFDNRDRVRD